MTIYGKQGTYFLSLIRPSERLLEDRRREVINFYGNKRRNKGVEPKQPKHRFLVDLVSELAGL